MDPAVQAFLAAAASFVAVILIFGALYVFCRDPNKRRRTEPTRNRPRTRNTRAIASNTDLSSITVTESATFDPSLNRISMPELVDATRDFSPELIIGDGSFGMVYKAKLASGVSVAVKKLSADAFQGFREFRAEMETLGKIRHPNIVKMLGYCSTGSDRVLIYEFVEKGSLDQWLYDTSSASDMAEAIPWMPLSWVTRINIVKGVAKGLAYMHNLDTAIIHRDIKASNILLDAKFEAYIADFGLARRIQGSHLHVSTQVAGTMGYMPPEYINGATKATTNGDVYSFGVLMLEIITGKRPNFPFKGEDGREIRLVNWVNDMVVQERYMEMVDTNLSKDGLNEIAVIEYFKIAMMCANENCIDRPPMNDVVEILNGIPAF
ncbi:leucine-rich repeat receptor protein kinase EMS1 [Nicotiana tabacum]|uniref:Leucine-rich repeat receptor protein kinase EMS1 n=1 Tax=Nicotiana tabacum TaxID=4097 RepID=A0A1S4AND0_TOBAC|nr:tyrosine-sulfated glycopeptide receptor 1 [Nicotiana tomentosiformis]XP_016478139.1 PREDICTED: tyrosine-sulfated glycopeptide receptor 1-like [Nicotiana tabacum]